MDKYLREVNKRIATTAMTAPAQRSAFKEGFSFSGLDFDEQLATWDYIWKHGKGFWPGIHAFFFLEKYISKKALHDKIWRTAVHWQDDVSDWGKCDCLSKIYTKVLESYPDKVYKQLQQWNRSKNPWDRRQSVVSLLYYTRTKKQVLPFDKISALITPLLNDKEYYVQKGVGWALRELHNAYTDETLAYFREHIHDISSIAFTAAMEKMQATEKEQLKLLRKEKRINTRGSRDLSRKSPR
jgi:3-methyladenine DNA glycosylase AlkD